MKTIEPPDCVVVDGTSLHFMLNEKGEWIGWINGRKYLATPADKDGLWTIGPYESDATTPPRG